MLRGRNSSQHAERRQHGDGRATDCNVTARLKLVMHFAILADTLA